MNAFHVCGALFAIWAVLVSFLGIRRENFPGSKGTERLVSLISVVLMLLAVGTAVYTGAAEEEEHPAGGEESALLRPS